MPGAAYRFMSMLCFVLVSVAQSSVFDVSSTPAPIVPKDSDVIMHSSGDNSETVLLQRYLLQQQLIQDYPALVDSASGLFSNLTQTYNRLQVLRSAVDNQTSILTADASAGGILATSRELMQNLPRTQKFLDSTINQLFKVVQDNAIAVNVSLAQAEQDYRVHMQSDSDSVANVLASQSAQMARAAYQQAGSMKTAAQQLGVQANTTMIQSTNSLLNAALAKISSASAQTSTVIDKASQALSDASEMPLQIQSNQQAKLDAVSATLQQKLADGESSAQDQLNSGSNAAILSVENSAGSLSANFQRSVSKVQKSVLSALQATQQFVQANVSQLNRTVEQSAATSTSQINQIESDFNNKIGSVSKNVVVTGTDANSTISDSVNLLNSLTTQAAVAQDNFYAKVGILQNSIPSSMNGVVDQTAAVGSSIGADSVNEFYNENGGISSIQKTSTQQLQSVGSEIGSRISSTKQGVARNLNLVANSIADASSALSANARGISQQVGIRGNNLNNNLQNVVSVIGGSVDDLNSVIQDSADTQKSALASTLANLQSSHSNGISGIMDSVQSVGQEGSNNLDQLMQTVVAPNSALTQNQFSDLTSMASTIAEIQKAVEAQQGAIMDQAKTGFNSKNSQLSNALSSVTQMQSSGENLVNGLSSNSAQLIDGLKTKLAQQAIELQGSATSSSTAGLNEIDKSISDLNNQFQVGQASVADSVANVSGSVDLGAARLSQLGTVSMQGIADLGSVSVSLLSQSQKQASTDVYQAKGILSGLQSGFVDNYKSRVATSLNAALSPSMGLLNSTKQNQETVSGLVTSLSQTLAGINRDLVTASQYNDAKSSELSSNISQTAQSVNQIKLGMNRAVADAMNKFQTALSNKAAQLNSTSVSLQSQLDSVKAMVNQTQDTLWSNLLLYKQKIDAIVSEIRIYMNMTGDSDEQAIRYDIAQQLSQVNASQVNLAAMNDAVRLKLNESAATQNSSLQSSSEILGSIIGSANSLAESNANGVIASNSFLTAVGLGADASLQQVKGVIADKSNTLMNAISLASSTNGNAIADSENSQNTIMESIRTKNADIASQGRQNYVSNLNSLSSLVGDVGVTSNRLHGIVSKTNETLSGVKASVQAHSAATNSVLKDLSSDQFSQVASVGDVMNVFSSVVTGFVNETVGAMNGLMSDLNLVDSVTESSVKAMKQRMGSAVDWIQAGVNSSSDSMSMMKEKNGYDQAGLTEALSRSMEQFDDFKSRYLSDKQNLQDMIASLADNTTRFKQSQIGKVQKWIADRSVRMSKSNQSIVAIGR